MTNSHIQLCQKLGYQFQDLALLNNALTHRSYADQHNERLEFLGDAILGFVIADKLFQQFPQLSEGKLTRLRANLVNQKTLATIAREYELGQHLILGPGEIKSGGATRDSLLSNLVEALFGAIYCDAGFNITQQVILNIYTDRLSNISLNAQIKDPKTRLQEYLQANQAALPQYEIQTVAGKAHEKQFIVSCHIDGLKQQTQGTGSSRRKAEQAAAEQALHLLKANTHV